MAAALTMDKKTFIVHLPSLRAKISIHLAQKVQIALLLNKKVSIPPEYINFLDIFVKKSAAIFFNCLDINKYAI